MDARYAADTKIANSNREFQMRKAEFDQEVNTKRAEAELAYQLQVECSSVFLRLSILCCIKLMVFLLIIFLCMCTPAVVKCTINKKILYYSVVT